MATSLAQQLQKLAVPQSTTYGQDKKRISILFDPKEAASIDRETFYEIGLSGLLELKAIDSQFAAFEKNLFNISSKNFERSVQSSDANEKINETIENFLISLSPYFLLQASHKALEWVINRYHIHKYNKDEFLSLILPYHETKIFVRCLQIMKINNDDKWNWLEPLQKPGIILPKSTLFNHCSSNPSFMKFVWKIVDKSIKVFESRPDVLTTLFTFYCSSIVGALEHSTTINEAHITNILPGLLHCLTSPIEDLKAAGYMILAQLLSKVQLKHKILKCLVSSIISNDSNIEYETVLLLHLLFHTQENLTKVTEMFLCNLSVPSMKNMCVNLSLLIAENVDVSKFLVAFMRRAFELVQCNVENLKRFSKLLEMLASEMKFNSKTAELLIKCAVDSYSIRKTATDDGDDSDMEVVDEIDNVKISLWYSNFLKSFESKYPNEFDKVLKNQLKQGENDAKKSLSEIIGFAPKLVDKLGDTFLFEKLYHPNASVRLEASKYLVDNYAKLSKKNTDFLKESVIDRLRDEDPTIVSTILSINLNVLMELLDGKQLVDTFKNIISKGPNDSSWRTAVSMSLNFVCLLESHEKDISLILSVLPYLFPINEESLIFTRAILQSHFIDEFLSPEITTKCLENNDPIFISTTIFKNFKTDFLMKSKIDLNNVINKSSKEKDYKSNVMAFIILGLSLEKCENLKASASVKLLKKANKFIDHAHVTCKEQYSSVNPKSIAKVLEAADNGKFPLQVYSFFLSKLIKNTTTTCATFKPWLLNTSVSEETEYLSMIFEIILKGCTDKMTQIFSPLLQDFIRASSLKNNTPQDNIEFIANFVVGSFTQETKNKLFNECSMIQIRSLRLLRQLISTHPNGDVNWILTSDVMLVMILLALYSDITFVREITLDILKIVVEKSDKKHFINSLLKEFLSRKEEIVLDNEQVPMILYNLLSPEHTANKLLVKTLKTPMKKSLDHIVNIVTKYATPFYAKAKICHLLNLVNSGSILTTLSAIALELFKYHDHGILTLSNIHQSMTLSNIISRVNSKTLKSSIENDEVWNMICISLKNYNFSIAQPDGEECVNVAVLMMQQIDQELFSVLSHQYAEKIVSLTIEAATFGKSGRVISTSTKLLKRLELNDKHVSFVLQSMLKVCDNSNVTGRKRKSFAPPLSALETNEWKCGNTLLECIQNKNKLSGFDRILPVLFKVLKKCLEFEEQSPVEYTKQLVLSSILHCCQEIHPIDGASKLKSISSGVIDVELIVMCIRGSQNPQTHHHALMLLSQAAYMIPDKVLHHIMAIFTFIGSSVLRHDDAYSFQIITKIIDTVIPILVKSGHTFVNEETIHDLEKSVIPVLRIFVDVALDIPEHRRLPLFIKLLQTLNPEYFVWNFLCLLFESHIVHHHEDKKVPNEKKFTNKEQPIQRLDFAMSVILEFPVDVMMQSCIKLLTYLKSLPIDKPEDDAMEVDSDPAVIFSITSHTSKELRHFKYTIVTFINNLLSSPIFTQKLNAFTDKSEIETLYKTFIVSILTYVQVVSKAADQNATKPQGKYWKVMLHHSYEILDNVNAHLPPNMFVIVVRGLMSHNLQTVRRKSMEIFNTKLQHQPAFFADCEEEIMYSVLEPLIEIVSEINKEDVTENSNRQEQELNQQTALLSLKLLARLLAQENPDKFKPILDIITNLVKSDVSSNLMASIVLCLAELCSNLKAHAIAFLPKFMPPLIKLLKIQNTTASSELVMLSIITAVYKIIETIPQFLSPYLEKLLYEFSILSAKCENNDLQKKSPAVTAKLLSIRNKISVTIAPRVLIPVVSQCYSQLIRKNKLSAVGPAMLILADSFTGISSAEFTSLQQELTSFFLIALQFRNDHKNDLSLEDVNDIEDHVIKALVSLVLKLSESSFRPLYFKIYDWAVRNITEDDKERAITFYRLSSSIAENLKGLFILFAGHFVKNAADLLDKCNKTKNEATFFESEDECCLLIESVVKTLHSVFLYDSQNFVNKERFETIMQPLVEQLDNEVGGVDSLKTRSRSLLIPCIAQFGIATADDSLWKPLNYQILLKTRHNDSHIRLLGLECMCEMASKLGESWLPLLPESIPFLAELLEDEVKEVESATQKAVQTLEGVLGEPLQKYF